MMEPRHRFKVIRDASGAVAHITRPGETVIEIRLTSEDLVRLLSDAAKAFLYVARIEGREVDAPPDHFIGFAGE